MKDKDKRNAIISSPKGDRAEEFFDKIARAGIAAMLINETHFGFCIIHFLICHCAVGEQSLVVARRWPVTRLQPRIMQTGKSAFYFHLLIARKRETKTNAPKEKQRYFGDRTRPRNS